MSTGASALEAIARQLAEALRALGPRLGGGAVSGLVAELGHDLPADVAGSGDVVARAGALSGAATALGPRITTLTEAVDAGNPVAIATAGQALLTAAEAVFDGIAALAAALDAASAAAADLSPQQRDELRAFAASFARRLLDHLVVGYLEAKAPVLTAALGVLGLVDRQERPGDGTHPAHVRQVLRLDRLPGLLSDPAAHGRDLYGWGTTTFDGLGLLGRLQRLVEKIYGQATLIVPPDGPPVLEAFLFNVAVDDEADPPGLTTSLRFPATEDVRTTYQLPGPWRLEVDAAARFDADIRADIRPPLTIDATPPAGTVEGEITARLVGEQPGDAVTLLSAGTFVRLVARRVTAGFGMRVIWDTEAGTARATPALELHLEGASLAAEPGDAFLRAIAGQRPVDGEFDLVLSWSADGGLRVEGSAGLRARIPVRTSLIPFVDVRAIELAAAIDAQGITARAGLEFGANLGPLHAAVTGLGLDTRLTFPQDGGGNLGQADLDLSFAPPEGIQLSVDSGMLRGGGFLQHDPERGEYSGALELSTGNVPVLGPISIKAIGILTTRLPDSDDGWALLLLLFSEFKGFQLGFGFTLDGIGGIIGLQHGVSTDALQAGLRTGVLDSVLFPANPVRDAPILLDQLRAVFPIVPRALTVGPALKIGWGTPPLVTIKLGVVLRFGDVLGATPGPPSLQQIVLLGQLLVQAPPRRGGGGPRPILQLKVDLVGSYDVDERSLAIDALLHDSWVGFAALSGTMVIRARFGRRPNLILAVGGFHPRFRDIPPGIPPQRRVGFQIAQGPVTIDVRGYLAVTTNTFQVGVSASLVARGGNFAVRGSLGFDALFVLEPVFRFTFDFQLSASVSWKRHTLAAIRVAGSLSGPGRWSVSGTATLRVLFFKIHIRFSESWGISAAPARTTIDAAAALVEALRKPDAWSTALPDGEPLVTLRQPATETGVVAHPLSELTLRQTVVPLGVQIDRVGEARPTGARRFTVDSVEIGGESRTPQLSQEHFARGQYFDLSSAQRLSAPSFEQFDAGVVVAADAYTVGADSVGFEPDWETGYLDPSLPTTGSAVAADLLEAQTRVSPSARSPLRSRFPNPGLRVTVDAPGFVVDAGPLSARTGAAGRSSVAEPAPSTYTAARQRAGDSGALVSEEAELVTR